MQYMNCGKDKGVKIMAELDTGKGIGLIQRVKRGLGKPTIIYVKSFIIRKKQRKNRRQEPRNRRSMKAEIQRMEQPKSRLLKNRSLEFWKTEVQRPEKPKSRLLKNRSLEFGKAEAQRSEKPTLIILIIIILI